MIKLNQLNRFNRVNRTESDEKNSNNSVESIICIISSQHNHMQQTINTKQNKSVKKHIINMETKILPLNLDWESQKKYRKLI